MPNGNCFHCSNQGHYARNPLVRLQHGFETRFERVRGIYRDTLALALARPWRFAGGFLAVVLVSFLLVPWLGQNFFPSTDSGQIKLHIRGQSGLRVAAALSDLVLSEHAVEVAVNRLRTKLGPAAGALETTNRRGYRLAVA